MLNKKQGRTAVTIILALALVACASFSTTSYKTLATTVQIVETARQAYNVLYNEGKIDPALDAKVAVIYSQYQLAANAAVSALGAYTQIQQAGGTPSQANVTVALTSLETVVNNLIAIFNQAGNQPIPTPQSVQLKALQPVKVTSGGK